VGVFEVVTVGDVTVVQKHPQPQCARALRAGLFDVQRSCPTKQRRVFLYSHDCRWEQGRTRNCWSRPTGQTVLGAFLILERPRWKGFLPNALELPVPVFECVRELKICQRRPEPNT